MDSVVEQVLREVKACLCQIPTKSLAQARDLIESAPRIFVSGAGRSGLCMRALGMRLMHIGKTVFVVGETVTPSITSGDLLILGSGSGRTASRLTIAQRARCQGAKILLFTTDASTPIAQLSDQLVIIPAPSLKIPEGERDPMSMQPMGTLFEQSLLILCDSLILSMMRRSGIDVVQMLERHANLE